MKQLLGGLVHEAGAHGSEDHAGSGSGGEGNPADAGDLPHHNTGEEGAQGAANDNGEQIGTE